MSIDAVISFAARYAELARHMTKKETNPTRQKELLQIAVVCSQVPVGPARMFHEAIQSLWFVHIGLMMEGYGFVFVPGQLDQYLLPIYEADLKAGRLTRPLAKPA